MPRIAAYVKELLDEEQYGTEYMKKLPLRLDELNTAQLNGMSSHLIAVKENSTFKLWKEANAELVSRMDPVVKSRNAAAAAEEARLTQERLKREHHADMIRAKKEEEKRVLQKIDQKAKETAEKEIADLETKRQYTERVELMEKAAIGDEKRWRLIKFGSAFFIVAVVLIGVFVKNIVYLIIGIVCALCITSLVMWRAYTVAILTPLVVTKEDLEKQITVRTEDLVLKARNNLKQKEADYKAKLLKEREDRRRYRRDKKEKEEIERMMLENKATEDEEDAIDLLAQLELAQRKLHDGPEQHATADYMAVEDIV